MKKLLMLIAFMIMCSPVCPAMDDLENLQSINRRMDKLIRNYIGYYSNTATVNGETEDNTPARKTSCKTKFNNQLAQLKIDIMVIQPIQ